MVKLHFIPDPDDVQRRRVIMLDNIRHNKLQEVSDETGQSRSEILRTMIDNITVEDGKFIVKTAPLA